jgi:hypothetical protein
VALNWKKEKYIPHNGNICKAKPPVIGGFVIM